MKKIIALITLVSMLSCVSCTSNEKSSSDSEPATTATTTEAVTTEAEDATTTTEVAATTVASNGGSAVDPNTGAETTYTKLEILKQMYNLAGIVNLKGDVTDDTYVDTAIDFGYFTEAERSTINDKATAGWVLLTMYRYGAKLDESSTEKDAIDLALQEGLIDEDEISDVSGFNDNSIKVLFDLAEDSRNHRDFGETSVNIELQDDVVDLTSQLDASKIEISSDNKTITVPDEYYDLIPTGKVVIFPDGGSGKAYKVNGKASVGSGTSVSVEPADIEDVYSSIHYSGSVKLD